MQAIILAAAYAESVRPLLHDRQPTTAPTLIGTIGSVPAERPVEPGDIVATIFHSLGFDLETHLPGPAGRPFPLVDFGCHEIHELF